MAMYRDRSWERQSSLVNNNPTPFQVTSALFSGQSLLAFKSSQLYDIFKTWPFVSLENDNAQPFVYNARKWLKEPSAHVPQLFGSVFHAAVHSTEATKADALFSLAVLAFEGHSVTAVLPYFVGFFQHHRPLATCGLPPAIIYENLAQGLLPDVRVLTAFAKQTSVPYASTPSARLPQEVDEDLEDWDQRRRDHFDRRQVELSRLLVQQVSSQWNPAFSSPRLSIAHIDSSASQYYALSELQDLVEAYYERLLENNRLNNFATSVESCISRLFGVLHQPQPPPVSPKLQSKPLSTSKPNSCRVHPTSLKHLIDIRAPPQPSVTLPTGNKTVHVHCDKAENAEELEYIAQDLARDGVPLHSFCARGLQASITSLTHRSEATETTPLEGISIPLKLASSMLKDFRVALKPSSPAELVLEAAGLWPSCDLRSVLTLLQQINRTSLTSEWLSSLCQLSAAVILGQQHTRISRLRRTRQKIDLDRELSNLVALDVDQLRQYPDWALIQVSPQMRLLTLEEAERVLLASRSTAISEHPARSSELLKRCWLPLLVAISVYSSTWGKESPLSLSHFWPLLWQIRPYCRGLWSSSRWHGRCSIFCLVDSALDFQTDASSFCRSQEIFSLVLECCQELKACMNCAFGLEVSLCASPNMDSLPSCLPSMPCYTPRTPRQTQQLCPYPASFFNKRGTFSTRAMNSFIQDISSSTPWVTKRLWTVEGGASYKRCWASSVAMLKRFRSHINRTRS